MIKLYKFLCYVIFKIDIKDSSNFPFFLVLFFEVTHQSKITILTF